MAYTFYYDPYQNHNDRLPWESTRGLKINIRAWLPENSSCEIALNYLVITNGR